MSDKNRVILLSILAFLVLVIWITKQIGDKWYEKKDTKKEILGVVVFKYMEIPQLLDRARVPMLRIANSTGHIEIDVGRWQSSWTYAEIGDTISKPSGTLILTVIKPSGEHELFEYHEW
jgi:hypothetical protein